MIQFRLDLKAMVREPKTVEKLLTFSCTTSRKKCRDIQSSKWSCEDYGKRRCQGNVSSSFVHQFVQWNFVAFIEILFLLFSMLIFAARGDGSSFGTRFKRKCFLHLKAIKLETMVRTMHGVLLRETLQLEVVEMAAGWASSDNCCRRLQRAPA